MCNLSFVSRRKRAIAYYPAVEACPITDCSTHVPFIVVVPGRQSALCHLTKYMAYLVGSGQKDPSPGSMMNPSSLGVSVKLNIQLAHLLTVFEKIR